MITIDENLYLWVNGLAGHFAPLDWLMKGIANDYFVIIASCMALLALWSLGKSKELRDRNQKGVICASISLGLAQAFVSICNAFCFRTRPFDVLPANLLFYRPTDSSLPSNSVSVVFGLAFAVYLSNKKAGRWLLALASLHAFSRVYVGIHYPFDVIAGAAGGIIIAFLVTKAVRLLDRQISWLLSIARKLYIA